MNAQTMVTNVGVGFRHELELTVDQPVGSKDYVFLHFLTPVEINTVAGRVIAEPRNCLLYAPSFPQWYRGHGVGLGNDWFRAQGREWIRLIRQYQMPLNQVLQPDRTDFVAMIMTELSGELITPDTYSRRRIYLLAEQLLLLLSRSLKQKTTGGLSARKQELFSEFQKVRSRVREEPNHPWSVGEMARMAHLSKSRFGPLYREFFGVSAGEDLIRVRLERAKWLLIHTTQGIGPIAEQSGFTNVYHFSRMFHQRVGCPPRHYPHQYRR